MGLKIVDYEIELLWSKCIYHVMMFSLPWCTLLVAAVAANTYTNVFFVPRTFLVAMVALPNIFACLWCGYFQEVVRPGLSLVCTLPVYCLDTVCFLDVT